MVAWQSLGIFFKKVSKSRTLWVGSGVSIFAVFAYIALLAGMTITTSGDIFCNDTCEIYVNVSSTYWRVCFSDDKFEPLYFNKEPINYKVYVPSRGKDNWRELKAGDCIERVTKSNTLPARFKVIVEKNRFETIKYGVKVGLTDIDPILYAENFVSVNDKTYEKVCNPVYGDVKKKRIVTLNYTETIPIVANETRTYLSTDLKDCKEIINFNHTDYCNKTYIQEVFLENKEFIVFYNSTEEYTEKEQIDCKYTGEVKEIGEVNKSISVENYFCGVDGEGVICDEARDSLGGFGDSNRDGICQKGETCVRQ